MEKAYINGKMAEFIKAIINVAKKMVRENIFGQMGEYFRDNG